jgi:hypothetical protein
MSVNLPFLRQVPLVILSIVLLPGCAELKQKSVEAREDNLAAAGFMVKPANTPERQNMLRRLPPNKFVTRTNGDSIHYVYADPLVCACLYVGSQQAYQQFQQHEQQQRLADEQRMTAEAYSDPGWNWSAWGPWGSGFRYGRGW